MSAFLGPIHFWLYNKIRFQEDLIDALCARAVSEGWITEEDTQKFVSTDRRELQDAIDESNIHGWLQGRIHDGEGRYAALVTTLLQEDANRLQTLKDVAFYTGKEKRTEVPTTAPEAFHQLDNTLLNGMPCDQVMKVTESNPDKVVWEETQDLHSSFWNGQGAYYYDLRAELIKGILADSGLTFKQTDTNRYETIK